MRATPRLLRSRRRPASRFSESALLFTCRAEKRAGSRQSRIGRRISNQSSVIRIRRDKDSESAHDSFLLRSYFPDS